MQLDFHMDPEGDFPHIYRHNVDEQGVLDVLRNLIESFSGREGSKKALGQTQNGRFLQVIFSDSLQNPGNIFVMTAYEMTAKRVKALRRRMKK